MGALPGSGSYLNRAQAKLAGGGTFKEQNITAESLWSQGNDTVLWRESQEVLDTGRASFPLPSFDFLLVSPTGRKAAVTLDGKIIWET